MERTKTGLDRYIERLQKSRDFEDKFKANVLMHKYKRAMDLQDFKAKEDYKQKIKSRQIAQDQDQLRNQGKQVGSVDEAARSVEVPGSKLGMTPAGKVGTYQASPRNQSSYRIATIDKHEAAKKAENPNYVLPDWLQKVRANEQAKLNPKDVLPKAYKPNKSTTKLLEDISKRISTGHIKSQEDANMFLDKNSEWAAFEGADIKHIQKRIEDMLPEAEGGGKTKGFLGTGLGSQTAKMVRGQWYVNRGSQTSPKWDHANENEIQKADVDRIKNKKPIENMPYESTDDTAPDNTIPDEELDTEE